MLQNPELLQQIYNPQVLQNITQMRQMMQGAGGAPGGMQAGAPGAGAGGFDMAAMMQAMQGMGGAGAGGAGGAGDAAAQDERPAEDRFATQITQLEGMGFPDKNSNIQALSMANGDVNQAINFLLGG